MVNTGIAAAYDNIRILRFRIGLQEQILTDNPPDSTRGQAASRVRGALLEDLLCALNDFAALGFEEDVADLLNDGVAK